MVCGGDNEFATRDQDPKCHQKGGHGVLRTAEIWHQEPQGEARAKDATGHNGTHLRQDEL